jgi:hypothetical protein
MGRKSREKRARREAQAAAPALEADRARRLEGVEVGQGALEEGDGLAAGLSNGRPYALVRRDEPAAPTWLTRNEHGADEIRPTWRRVWLRPGRPRG